MTLPRGPVTLAAVVVVLIAATFWCATPAYAQGTIFGTVKNADATNPAPTELLWVGFLDDTDEEIRIESNAGAGYDGVNWFDDFQNYTTEAAGNPYDFFYMNIVNGQAFHLASTIPSNSFHEEDVVLTPAAPPARPTGLTATAVSPTTVELAWDGQPGLTYHVYRRVTSNNGVFHRLDDPTGSLAHPGVAGSLFADVTSDGASSYTYVIVAEDAQGNYSAHSTETAVDAAGPFCACDCHGDPSCDGVTNVLDVVQVVNVGFRGGAALPDPNDACPFETTDVDCSGFTNVLDVVRIVDVAFRGGDPALKFADPCAP
ncbi:MAG TPA: hypothetical protein VM118_15115 [Acidobacteriota bacterium]|nr:hypothetical protein [Acidobacteriota bacterium]